MDGDGFIFVGNQELFVSADRGDWQSEGLFGVDFMCHINNF